MAFCPPTRHRLTAHRPPEPDPRVLFGDATSVHSGRSIRRTTPEGGCSRREGRRSLTVAARRPSPASPALLRIDALVVGPRPPAGARGYSAAGKGASFSFRSCRSRTGAVVWGLVVVGVRHQDLLRTAAFLSRS
ncbi:hypothetical protein ACFPM0_05835 [Pseudonocardia sulfidoxydans]|uniref:hypothetical protein n=1 Tax=Pseudonocardia sulfidoxydans TaxID=54011 RepID=UPI00361E8D7B